MLSADYEETMKQWDAVRKEIAEGSTSSWPRDWFESVLDVRDERIAVLEAECAAAQQMEAALIHAADRLTVLGEHPEHPVQLMIEQALAAYSPREGATSGCLLCDLGSMPEMNLGRPTHWVIVPPSTEHLAIRCSLPFPDDRAVEPAPA